MHGICDSNYMIKIFDVNMLLIKPGSDSVVLYIMRQYANSFLHVQSEM